MTTFWHDRRDCRGLFPVPHEATGGPSDDGNGLVREDERMGFIERKLDALARRVEALEARIKADSMAPLDPREEG